MLVVRVWGQCESSFVMAERRVSISHIHLRLCLQHTESDMDAMKHSIRRCECHRDLAQLINKTYAVVRERLPTDADGCLRHPFVP